MVQRPKAESAAPHSTVANSFSVRGMPSSPCDQTNQPYGRLQDGFAIGFAGHSAMHRRMRSDETGIVANVAHALSDTTMGRDSAHHTVRCATVACTIKIQCWSVRRLLRN